MGHALIWFYCSADPDFWTKSMSTESRIVFIVSDGTGITAENFSQSILAQFEATFKHVRVPFVDSVDKAHDAVSSINQTAAKYGVQPIVFTTLVNS